MPCMLQGRLCNDDGGNVEVSLDCWGCTDTCARARPSLTTGTAVRVPLVEVLSIFTNLYSCKHTYTYVVVEGYRHLAIYPLHMHALGIHYY